MKVKNLNQTLMEENSRFKSGLIEASMEIAELEIKNRKLEEENKKLKETIKDHQLYEEKLEHRIIEFEELLHWE